MASGKGSRWVYRTPSPRETLAALLVDGYYIENASHDSIGATDGQGALYHCELAGGMTDKDYVEYGRDEVDKSILVVARLHRVLLYERDFRCSESDVIDFARDIGWSELIEMVERSGFLAVAPLAEEDIFDRWERDAAEENRRSKRCKTATDEAKLNPSVDWSVVQAGEGYLEQAGTEEFAPSDDFRFCRINGVEYTFTASQAAMIRALYDDYRKRRVGVSRKALFEAAGLRRDEQRVDHVFRMNRDNRWVTHPAWKAGLIESVGGGVYRLRLKKNTDSAT
jgi:hypothetical protein